MHCTEMYLQVEEYPRNDTPQKLRLKQISFKAEVPLDIRLKATTILIITNSLGM